MLLCLLWVGGEAAEGKESLGDLWETFQQAPSLEAQRDVVRRLDGWSQRDRFNTLVRWIDKMSSEPESVALLARAMLDAWQGPAARRLLILLKEDDFRACRGAILRVLQDGPEPSPLHARHFGKRSLMRPSSYLLASRLAERPERLPATRGSRGLRALADVVALLRAPPEEGAWAEVVRLAAALPPLAPSLLTRLAWRLRTSLPRPKAADLERLPAPFLHALWQAGETGALGAVLASGGDRQAAQALREVAERRDPGAIDPLVDALERAEPYGPTFYRILALLQDLTGASVPPDPDQWRSWIAGHGDWLSRQTRMPPTDNTEAAVNAGIAFLLSRQAGAGSFSYEGGRGSHVSGTTALVLYALVEAGVPTESEALHRAAAYLARPGGRGRVPDAYTHNYTAGLAAMALEALDAKRYRNELQQVTLHLVAGQQKSGGWTYGLPYGTRAARDSKIDLSNTQYSVLGLRSAAFAKLQVPATAWEGVVRLLRGAEVRATGDWLYYVPGSSSRSGMAAIAAASLLIARSRLEEGLRLEDVLADEQMVRALRSMARKYGRGRAYDRLDSYTLYSVERVGALFGIYSFDSVPWYQEGRRVLLDRQLEDGGWGRKDDTVEWWETWGRNVDTAYALLFLRRATTPVFSAGLDVPSNADLPIQRVAPRRDDGPAETRHVVDPDAAPRKADPIAGERSVGSFRDAAVATLLERVDAAESAVDRLALWGAVVDLDPLDAVAHVMTGETLGSQGRWGTSTVLDASLPVGDASEWVRREIRGIFEQTAAYAMREATSGTLDEAASRSLLAYALDLRRQARTPR